MKKIIINIILTGYSKGMGWVALLCRLNLILPVGHGRPLTHDFFYPVPVCPYLRPYLSHANHPHNLLPPSFSFIYISSDFLGGPLSFSAGHDSYQKDPFPSTFHHVLSQSFSSADSDPALCISRFCTTEPTNHRGKQIFKLCLC